jgi:hypothetical protein
VGEGVVPLVVPEPPTPAQRSNRHRRPGGAVSYEGWERVAAENPQSSWWRIRGSYSYGRRRSCWSAGVMRWFLVASRSRRLRTLRSSASASRLVAQLPRRTCFRAARRDRHVHLEEPPPVLRVRGQRRAAPADCLPSSPRHAHRRYVLPSLARADRSMSGRCRATPSRRDPQPQMWADSSS